MKYLAQIPLLGLWKKLLVIYPSLAANAEKRVAAHDVTILFHKWEFVRKITRHYAMLLAVDCNFYFIFAMIIAFTLIDGLDLNIRRQNNNKNN